MKISLVKTLFAIAIGAILGYICKIISIDSLQWYSLAIGGISMIGSMILAFASYPKANNQREANTKLVAIIMMVVMVLANIIFAFTNYKTDVYIVVIALLLVIDGFIVYRMVAK